VVIARVLTRLNGGQGSEIPRRSRRQVRFTYAGDLDAFDAGLALRMASLYWISLSESKSIGVKSVRPARGVVVELLAGEFYWDVAAVGSVFEVAICAAMGTLEVAPE